MLETNKLAAQMQMAAESLAQCHSAAIDPDECTKRLEAFTDAEDRCAEARYYQPTSDIGTNEAT